MSAGIRNVDSSGEDGDRDASGRQRAAMGRGIDAERRS